MDYYSVSNCFSRNGRSPSLGSRTFVFTFCLFLSSYHTWTSDFISRTVTRTLFLHLYNPIPSIPVSFWIKHIISHRRSVCLSPFKRRMPPFQRPMGRDNCADNSSEGSCAPTSEGWSHKTHRSDHRWSTIFEMK